MTRFAYFPAGLLALAALLLFPQPARANLPNGGSGTGANVTLVNNGNGTVTLQNGIVNALIKTTTAQILQLTYNGTQVTDGGTSTTGAFYWQGTSGSADTLVTIANTANYAEIELEDPATSSGNGADAHRHFSMFRGSPGIYVTEILTRNSTAAAAGVDTVSFTCKLGSFPMNWIAQDANSSRFLAMPNVNDLATATAGVNFAPKEAALLTTGNFAGQFDCKYDYAGDLGSLTTTGWCSNTSDIGLWLIHPSNEYFDCGPMHREILAQLMIINCTFKGTHFGFGDDSGFAAGETWAKVFGPFFLYFNKVSQGTANPTAVLYADALAQAHAERSAWPYSWFTDGNYTQASGRGTVTGNIIINDSGNPNASAANLWVGVAQQPSSTLSPATTDFQLYGKKYQYWVKTGANGNFTIPNVLAGSNYTLFAFGPGAIGQFQSQLLSGASPTVTVNYPATPFSVTVTGGNTTSVGNVTWTPTRTGNTVWEIGVPDRDTQEFRHGDDFWHGDHGNSTVPAESWAPWENFRFDFPNGLTYAVGSSHWANDWNYAQPTVLDPTTGNENTQVWTITFTMPQGPVNGATACIYMGIAADFSGPVEVTVNNTNLGSTSGVTATPTGISSTGFFPYYSGSGCDAMIRMSSHGIFCDERITFPGSLLKAGANTITLNMRKGGYFSDSALYDYVRLELSGYIPPAPLSLAALAGNSLVLLRWPAAPGATSYNLLRSTTSGSGYASIATNITGPVSGSTNDIASYTDSTAANNTPYYYVIQSVNSSGASANSTQATATPSASAPSAPAAPTGLSATPGDEQVTLNWTASANAAYYLVSRSLTSGGPYVTVNSTVTGASYTDPARSNALTYYYVVAAANAAGAGANSTEVNATPYPTAPTTPVSLSAATGSGGITLSWTPITGVTNYIVKRATSSGGPYTTLTTTINTSFFSDTTAAGNTTYYYTVTAANLGGLSANSSVLGLTSPPAAPTGVVATPASANVTLTWTASTGATSYTVSRATVTGGPYSTVASGLATTTYANTGLTNDTTYYFVIQAANGNGTSEDSTEVVATPLAAPAGLAIASGYNANITVSWGNVTGAATYTVHRGTVSGGPYSTAVATNIAANTTINTGLTNGTAYYYVVSAANANTTINGLSSNSTPISATPLSAPTGVAATGSSGNATLTWTAPAGATSYNIYRSLTNGSGFASVNSTVTAPPYVNSGLTNGTTYYYLVAAQAANSLSGNSTQVSAVPLSPPGNFAAAGGTANVTLTWTASAGATSYVVRRGTVTGGPYTLLTSGATGASYPDNGTANGTTYYYIIAAAATGGLSGNSAEASATPLAAPANLTATPGNGNITLTWTGATGATAYTVKRGTSSGGETTLATGVTGATYKDLTAANGTKYYYTLTATAPNSAGASSAETTATPQIPAPAAPADLAATAGNGNVTLTWSPVAGASTYTLARATTPGAETPLAAGLATGPYLDADVTNGTVYYYILTATNAGGTGPNSPEVTATPAATLSQWAATAFGNSTDANLTAPNANPAGDGIPNLLKYFYGLDPTTNSGTPPVTTTPDTSGNLLLTFHLSKNTSGLTYQIQSSPDLATWTNTGVQGTVLSDQGPYYLMQAAIPLNSNPHLYLRIKVIGQ